MTQNYYFPPEFFAPDYDPDNCQCCETNPCTCERDDYDDSDEYDPSWENWG